jgi:methyl-accepting chemotaxis protein
MGSRIFKRRQILVDKDFQFRYLMTWILLTMSLLGGLVIASLSMFYFLGDGLFTHFVWVNATCAVVITGISLYYIVLHSHRIAGPAYRLERLIKEMAEGRRGFRVRLRRKDYLKHIASALNELLESLESRENRIHELGRRVGELSDNGSDVARVHRISDDVSRELSEMCPLVTSVTEDGKE